MDGDSENEGSIKSRRANSHSISLARCIAEVRGPLMLMPVISVQNFFDLIDAKASENLAAKKESRLTFFWTSLASFPSFFGFILNIYKTMLGQLGDRNSHQTLLFLRAVFCFEGRNQGY